MRIPSLRQIVLLLQNSAMIRRITGANNAKRASIYEAARNGIGAITDVTPRTMRILRILDPITFPIARSGLHLRAARMEVTSSGALVPIAIIVRPIID